MTLFAAFLTLVAIAAIIAAWRQGESDTEF